MNEGTPVRPPPDRDIAPQRMSRLTQRECLELLQKGSVGRLAYVTDGWPVVLPVNYALAGHDIFVRTDPGSKLSALTDSATVSFEIDSFESLYQSGWSVLVHARAEEVARDDRDRLIATHNLRSWAEGAKAHVIRLTPVQMTGRRLARAWRYPDPIPRSDG